MQNIQRILVVCRYHANVRFAVDTGVYLANKFGAKMSFLFVSSVPADLEAVNSPDLLFQNAGEYFTGRHQEETIILKNLIRDSKEPNLTIHNVISFGSSVEDVLEAVSANFIDLLVLISHEEGRLEHLLFGGDYASLVRQLPCSILLVKKEPGPVTWDTGDICKL